MDKLTVDRLRFLAHYEAGTGKFRWREDGRFGFNGSATLYRAGDEMGCARKGGRWVIRVDGRLYLRYRLAWLWVHGKWPDGEIDHINGDFTDDRLANLRDVPQCVNKQNIRFIKSNKESSKLLGVYLDKRKTRKKWRSSIMIDGKQKSLGYFLTQEEAHEAYLAAKRVNHIGCTV